MDGWSGRCGRQSQSRTYVRGQRLVRCPRHLPGEHCCWASQTLPSASSLGGFRRVQLARWGALSSRIFVGGNGEPKNKTIIMISTRKMQEQASSTLFEFEDSWIKSGSWDCLEIMPRLSNSMNLERKIEKGKVNLLKCSFTNVWREYEI